jgi:hypothetical protein
MQLLVCRRGDAERLFHEAVGFIAVSVDFIFVVTTVGRAILARRGTIVAAPSTSAFSLHFAVGEK